MARYKYLLGSTNDNELVFGEFGVTKLNEYHEFTASFDVVRPFREVDVDLGEFWYSRLEDYDYEMKYNLCEEYDCAPSELLQNLIDNDDDIMELFDCSLYPECYTIDNEDWYFESGACGQHDSSGDMAEYVNEDAYNALIDLWNNYHLKKVDENVIKKVDDIASALEDVDEEAWITDFIKRHDNEL